MKDAKGNYFSNDKNRLYYNYNPQTNENSKKELSKYLSDNIDINEQKKFQYVKNILNQSLSNINDKKELSNTHPNIYHKKKI